MPILSQNACWGRKEPSGVFEDSGTDDREFCMLAMKMMEKRRVEPHIQKKLIPSVRKALRG